MKKPLLVLFATIFACFSYAQIPDGYYDSATGTGYTLKTQLHNIIKTGHTAQSYGDLYDAYVEGDTDPEDGYVWDMYSENPDGADPYNYEHYVNNCGSYSVEGDCLNREHLFPQGIFSEASPMKTDYHHVVPSDGKVNGMRSSYPFGEVGTVSWTSLNGSKLGTCNYPGYTGTVFEPLDEFKGDIARCMLYFATRYEGQVESWSHTMLNGTSGQVYEDWFISLLVEWHNQDPVSSKDEMRNEAGYDFQGNRNPFIDHPEYVTEIWGSSGNSLPSITGISISPSEPNSTETVSVTASVSDHDGTITSVELHWGLSSGSLTNTIIMSVSTGDTYVTDSDIPVQTDGTVVYYEIEATDDDTESNSSSVKSYTVSDGGFSGLLNEDFSTCPSTGWVTYSNAGSENWECGTQYMQINAFGSDAACDDWLISPAQDLDSYENKVLTFISWTKYTDSYYPPIDVKYSVDYSGSGNPSLATWNDLIVTLSAENSESWTSSGNIDISSIAGEEVYFAFHYTSSGTGAGNCTQWEIDDVIITGDEITNLTPQITNIGNTPEAPTEEEDVTISATITDEDGTISSAKIKWGTESGAYPSEVPMTSSGDVYSGIVDAQTGGTTIYFVVEAEDNEGGSEQAEENNFTFSTIANNPPEITNVSFDPTNPDSNELVSVTATITDSDGTVTSSKIKWGTTSGSYPNEVDMANSSGDDYLGQIPAQADESHIYFVIHAIDEDGGSTQSSEEDYVVEDVNIAPEIANVSFAPTDPESTENVTVSATIIDSDGNISIAKVKWGSASGNYTNEETMNSSGDSYQAEIPSQADGTTVYFIVNAEDNESEITNSTEYTYTVADTENLAPVISNVELEPRNPTQADNVIISCSAVDSDGSIEGVVLKWKLESTADTETSMNFSGGKYYGQIPKQGVGETVYYSIIAEDNEGLLGTIDSSYEISQSSGMGSVNSKELRIYPNPAKGYLTVETPTNSFSSISLYNVLGKNVLNVNNLDIYKYTINLSKFEPGVYILQVQLEGTTKTQKVIFK